MKPFRIFLGIVIVVVFVWLIVTEQLSGASADATINAQLVSLRAPIAGELDVTPLPLGARLSRGQEFGTVRDTRADTVRLNDLELETHLAQAEVTDIETRRTVVDDAVIALQVRTEAYNTARIQELGIELVAARERLALATQQLELQGEDPNELDFESFENQADNQLNGATRLQPNWASPSIIYNFAKERVLLLENELNAALDGVYLGDGFNDAPFSEQRKTDLLRESGALESALTEAKSRVAAFVERTEAERLRVNRVEQVTLRSPASGTLYQALVTSGETVERGDPIAIIVDCATIFVTLSVTENVYDRLNTGDPATFRPRGSNRIFDASIFRLAGSGAARVYEDLAVAPSQKHLERFDVTLEVPGLREDEEFACAIGRTGRAYFDVRPLDWLRRYISF